MIYFVQAKEGGPIKIGYSANVWKRMSSLRSSNPEYLNLLGVMEGDRTEEKRVHSLFKRKQGEWFDDSPELQEFIRVNCDEALRPCPLLDGWDEEL